MAQQFIELDDGQVPEFISLMRGLRDDAAIGIPDSAEEIKAKYESNSNTNAFTDAEKTKLSGLDDYNFNLIEQNALDIIELKSPDSVDYTPQLAEPEYQEGKVWYDENEHLLAVQTDIEEVKIHLPTDAVMRVINRTGTTIQPLTAIRNGGTDASTYVIKAVPAQADSIFTAFVIGITPKEILPDQEGWVITGGHIHDVDTSAYAEGDTLFLSETVAGEMVTTNPKIATATGTITRSSVTAGQMFVKINSLITYPQAVGYMTGQANATYNLTTTAQDITGFASEDSVIVDPNTTTGEMTVPLNGIYTMTASGSFTFSATSSTREIYIELYDVTESVVKNTFTVNVPRDATAEGRSFTEVFTGTTGHVYKLRMRASESIAITVTSVTFSLTSNYIG